MQNRGLVFVFIGAIFECGWVYALKFANSNLEYCLAVGVVFISTYFFLQSFKYLPTSLAYILYIGLGTLFVVIVEVVATKEFDILRIGCILLLMVGIYGIKKGDLNA